MCCCSVIAAYFWLLSCACCCVLVGVVVPREGTGMASALVSHLRGLFSASTVEDIELMRKLTAVIAKVWVHGTGPALRVLPTSCCFFVVLFDAAVRAAVWYRCGCTFYPLF